MSSKFRSILVLGTVGVMGIVKCVMFLKILGNMLYMLVIIWCSSYSRIGMGHLIAEFTRNRLSF